MLTGKTEEKKTDYNSPQFFTIMSEAEKNHTQSVNDTFGYKYKPGHRR